MKVLVFAHRLELGGTQVNAIELAAAARDWHGYDIVMLATDGPARALAEAKGLRVLTAPDATHHPSAGRLAAVRAAVRDERPDLIHAWDVPQCLDAYFGAHVVQGTPLVCSVMSMVVPSTLPSRIPATFGAPALAREAERRRPGPVSLLEPPVDLEANCFDAVGATAVDAFKAEHGLTPGYVDVVVVSRLVEWMKLEGIEGAIRAMEALASETRLRLVIVGEGTSYPRVLALADGVNARVGDRRVVVAGGMVDPRPAYAAADIMLGMGGSALRAMSFAKPLVVLGERGFAEILTPTSLVPFLDAGFYGLGDGSPVAPRLEQYLRHLAARPEECRALGAFGEEVVRERYDLRVAARRVDELYRAALHHHRSRAARCADASYTAMHLAGRPVVARPREMVRSLRRSGTP
jgi:glycosyltransferase involved in cell wall biosynthesis